MLKNKGVHRDKRSPGEQKKARKIKKAQYDKNGNVQFDEVV